VKDREQMRVLLGRETLEAPLPDMAAATVVLVRAPDVTGQPPLALIHSAATASRSSIVIPAYW
jgi:hypothetical protein